MPPHQFSFWRNVPISSSVIPLGVLAMSVSFFWCRLFSYGRFPKIQNRRWALSTENGLSGLERRTRGYRSCLGPMSFSCIYKISRIPSLQFFGLSRVCRR